MQSTSYCHASPTRRPPACSRFWGLLVWVPYSPWVAGLCEAGALAQHFERSLVTGSGETSLPPLQSLGMPRVARLVPGGPWPTSASLRVVMPAPPRVQLQVVRLHSVTMHEPARPLSCFQVSVVCVCLPGAFAAKHKPNTPHGDSLTPVLSLPASVGHPRCTSLVLHVCACLCVERRGACASRRRGLAEGRGVHARSVKRCTPWGYVRERLLGLVQSRCVFRVCVCSVASNECQEPRSCAEHPQDRKELWAAPIALRGAAGARVEISRVHHRGRGALARSAPACGHSGSTSHM